MSIEIRIDVMSILICVFICRHICFREEVVPYNLKILPFVPAVVTVKGFIPFCSK